MFDSQEPMVHGWVKIVSLIIQLKEWEQKRGISLFAYERSGQLGRIKEHYKRLSSTAHYTFSLSLQAKDDPDVKALQDAISNFRSSLISEEKVLFSEICDFISQGVLKCCITLNARNKALKEIGFSFKNHTSEAGLSINQVITLFGLLLFLVLTNFILFRPPDADVERVILMVTMIVSIYSAAVVCGVYPKQQWTLFQYSETTFYPVVGYVLSGLTAVLFSICLSLFFKTLIFANDPNINGFSETFNSAWNDLTTNSYPWLVMSFATAVTTAFLIDWRKPNWVKYKWQRFVEACLQGVVLVTAAALVHWWLSGLSSNNVFTGRVPDLGSVLRIAAIIGVVIGVFVPSWYRSAEINVSNKEKDGDNDVVNTI